MFLEDDLNNIREHRSEGKRDGVEIHLVEYKFKASEAYDLLRYARNEEDCWYDFSVGWLVHSGLVEDPSPITVH